jgi:hypothetical protein
MNVGAASNMDHLSQGQEQCRRYQKAIVQVGGYHTSGERFEATGLLAESGAEPVIVAPDHGNTDHREWYAGSASAGCRLLSNAPKHSVILDVPRTVRLLEDIEPISEDECKERPDPGVEVFMIGFPGSRGKGFTQVRQGIVSTIKDDFFCVDFFVVQGTSGSPVWEAASGKLIGTIEMLYRTTVMWDDGVVFQTPENLTGTAPAVDWTQVIW